MNVMCTCDLTGFDLPCTLLAQQVTVSISNLDVCWCVYVKQMYVMLIKWY